MSEGPLSGIKVLEFGQNLAGPYCGQILTFLGATVVKIERPEGDDARRWGPPFIDEDDSPAVAFVALNRGKKSTVIDLNKKGDREHLINLIGDSDIFLHNIRVDVPKTFGFDSYTLTKKFHHAYLCKLGGFWA